MNGNNIPQSWYDFAVMPPMDPRSIVQTISFEDQAGTMRAASFARSTTWLHAVPWANPPLIVTNFATAVPNVTVPNTNDFDSVEAAAAWNSLHAMTATTPLFPIAVEKIMFLKAGTAFVNNIYLDFSAGITSQDILFSFSENSLTSGDFTGGGAGTIPVFAFPTAPTYGGTARNLQITLLRTGRFKVAFRILDSAANYSTYEMEWIVL
ncbi:MAG: hypothetical protein Q8902_03940 [Bacteroidota bacterium]|nr:hypothetical protein [Bacteroidota bacterium]MDP4232371.1 hypothetical protein [Bacteroidota bacterium]